MKLRHTQFISLQERFAKKVMCLVCTHMLIYVLVTCRTAERVFSWPHLTPTTTWLKAFTADLLHHCSWHLPAGEMELPERCPELWMTLLYELFPVQSQRTVTCERTGWCLSSRWSLSQMTATLIKSWTGFTLKTLSDVIDTFTSPEKQTATTQTSTGSFMRLLIPVRIRKFIK